MFIYLLIKPMVCYHNLGLIYYLELTIWTHKLTLSGPGFFDQPQPGGGDKSSPYLKFDPLELVS